MLTYVCLGLLVNVCVGVFVQKNEKKKVLNEISSNIQLNLSVIKIGYVQKRIQRMQEHDCMLSIHAYVHVLK